MKYNLKQGDEVIYVKTLHKTHPSGRAKNITPSAHGEDYCYTVDKFRKVKEVTAEGRIILVSPKGHTEICTQTDPALKKAGLVQRLVHHKTFANIPMDQ